MPLDLGDIQLTYEKFIDVLLNVELASYQTLKVACYLTEYDSWEDGSPSLREILYKNGFSLEPLGEIEKGTNYYFYDDFIMKVMKNSKR
ncbi:hypothetical protein ACFL0D_01385 [Thermoproteota archaeon]